MEGKHDIKELTYEPLKDDFYKARISTLEKENLQLRAELEKRASWVIRLREENTKLREALIREALSNV